MYNLLKDYMVRGECALPSVHHIFYFCFASLCYHFDFLKRILHSKNKLRASHFFTHIPIKIQAAATVKYPWNATEVTPPLTGLPPHITILANFERLMAEMKSTKNDILAGVEYELDRRHIGSQSHYDKEENLTALSKMHTEVMNKVDMCVRTSTTALRDVAPACIDALVNVNEIFVNDAEDQAETETPLTIVAPNRRNKFHYFFSKGEMKRLPNNFVFPHMTLCTLVVNWFCGNPSQKSMPLKYIVPADLGSKSMKCECRKMKVLMGAVIEAAKGLGVWDGSTGAWDVPRAMRLFENVQHLFEYPSTSTQQNDQISWKTIYNLYIKNKNRDRRGCGHGEHDNDSVGIGNENDDWMDAIEGTEGTGET